MARPITAEHRCPCGSGETYGACCLRLHAGEGTAPTALALMRSRFSAYAVGDVAYLLATWHSSTRPAELALDDSITWARLDIDEVIEGGLFDASGVVAFRAHYRSEGRRHVLGERSRFERESGCWMYVDGIVN